ncbi:MAG: hemerythrin domain-containing protein [Micromonosporaceae bacterium]
MAGMSDIVELIRADHQRIRDARQTLLGLAGEHGESARGLALAVWADLAGLIEVHADAEEEICHLSMYGTGPHGLAMIEEAVADLDDIREALREAALQPPCSTGWWRAVAAALTRCAEHCDRQERGINADFQQRASCRLRAKLAAQWVAFTAARRPG